jgi:lipopolysaccharide transport system ATP-binding protein
MAGEALIRCAHVSKQYRLGTRERYRTLRDAIATRMARPFQPRHSAPNERSFWALRDVSFEVERGEVVGIIGRNGAGKSTLLKILSRITEPTAGRAEIRGRLSALLEVGTGFHPELTGRENVFLNGAILGMKRNEIVGNFDDIVDFADIAPFIDTPVKHYSSGMYMRLAFAVAAHLTPEILCIDEVLAVGDLEFQRRCLGKMSEVARSGRTVLFVSHNLIAIESLCTSALLLDGGEIKVRGDVGSVIEAYVEAMSAVSMEADLTSVSRNGSGRLRFDRVAVSTADGGAVLRAGDDVVLSLRYTARERVRRPELTVAIYTALGVPLSIIRSSESGLSLPEVNSTGEVHLRLSGCNMMPGTYSIHLGAGEHGSPLSYDHIVDALTFTIEGGDVYKTGRVPSHPHGAIFFGCEWNVGEAAPLTQSRSR